MNWKYQEAKYEMLFPEPPELVQEAARAFAQSLGNWRVDEMADGFEAKGHVFAHAATAVLRCTPIASGTRATITLQVKRAGLHGYRLLDLGLYNRELRKWMEGIRWHLMPHEAAMPPIRHESGIAGKLLVSVFAFLFLILALSWITQFIFAVAALFTGWLYVLPYHGAHGRWYHGASALWRAYAILSFYLFLGGAMFFSMRADKKKRERPKILYPDG